MRNILNIIAVAGLSVLATSCFDKSKPNYQFFPNMYEPVPYETYSEHAVFPILRTFHEILVIFFLI
jgi:hypothetical protein